MLLFFYIIFKPSKCSLNREEELHEETDLSPHFSEALDPGWILQTSEFPWRDPGSGERCGRCEIYGMAPFGIHAPHAQWQSCSESNVPPVPRKTSQMLRTPESWASHLMQKKRGGKKKRKSPLNFVFMGTLGLVMKLMPRKSWLKENEHRHTHSQRSCTLHDLQKQSHSYLQFLPIQTLPLHVWYAKLGLHIDDFTGTALSKATSENQTNLLCSSIVSLL